MKNKLTTILIIAGLAIVIQSCKKEDLGKLNTQNNNISEDKPQSQSIQDYDKVYTLKNEIDMTDVAAAMTPQNYPLDPFQLLVEVGSIPTNDTTQPKIRRGMVVTIEKALSPDDYPIGGTVSYNYEFATQVYMIGNYYHVIHVDMILPEEND